MVEALILAGGLGTRLRSAVPDRPKPMALVAGRPFLEYLVSSLRRGGIQTIVLAIGHQADQVRRHFGDGARWELSIRYSQENEPLGTGGAIKLAGSVLTGDRFLVLNGDSFLQLDYGDLLHYHDAKRGLVTVAVTQVADRVRYGAVDLADGGAIHAVSAPGVARGAGWVHGGVCVVSRGLLDQIAPNRPVSLETDVLPRLVGRGLYGYPASAGYFIDIGTPASYREAQASLPERAQ